MDRAAWLWGAGAVVCGVLLCLLQPWSAHFRKARLTCQENGGLWAVPVLAAVAEMAWQWQAPGAGAAPRLPAAGVSTGDSLIDVLTWIVRGDVLSMLLAAAFLANSAGLRRGLWSGVAAVFSGRWRRVIQLVLLASATAALGIPAVRFGAGGESGHWIMKLLTAPWAATAATLLMCWLFLAFETACRGPAQAKIRRAEMAGQCTARLWVMVFIGAVTFPLMDWLSDDTRGILRWFAWPAVALLAWFPFTALRSTEAGEIHTVFSVALSRWAAGILPFAGWCAVAGVHFFALHLLTGWLVSLCPDGTWYRSIIAGILAAAQVALAVWMFGAWVTIQVDKVPVARKDRRKA